MIGKAPSCNPFTGAAILQPTLLSSGNGGNQGGGTTCTVTIPGAYTGASSIIIAISRNQAEAAPFTFDANVTSIEELNSAATLNRRFGFYRVHLNGTNVTQFVLTSVTSSIWSYWIGIYSNVVGAAVIDHSETEGGSTVSTMTAAGANLDYIASGNEVALSGYGVNATAAWTGNGQTVYAQAAGNASMLIGSQAVGLGSLTVEYASVDRGLNGTARTECTATIVLQGTPQGVPNLFINGSFEVTGGNLAATWQEEHTTTIAPTFSQSIIGVTDGVSSQLFSYTGQVGDVSQVAEIFEAPFPALAGKTATVKGIISGDIFILVNAILGVEAFDAGNTFLGESDLPINSVNVAPTAYQQSYVLPANTDHIAAYLQVQSISAVSSFRLYLDQFELTVA